MLFLILKGVFLDAKIFKSLKSRLQKSHLPSDSPRHATPKKCEQVGDSGLMTLFEIAHNFRKKREFF